ncbi:ankyrin [Hypoxylon sp. FL0890]|nr:ankyrin [Hypoxylon sp. FL0890]
MPFLSSQDPATSELETLFGELKSYAAHGDLDRLRDALENRWEPSEETDMSWFNQNMMDRFLRIHRVLHSDKAVVLQRVLNTAAQEGQVEVVKYLLDRGSCTITPPAIRWAFYKKHWDVLQVYLDRGWDINSPMEGGNTLPLINELIVSVPHTQWCLDHGADPMAANMFRSMEILSQAASKARPSVLQVLKDGGADFTKSNALQSAASSGRDGRTDIMAFLLDEAGVSINMREFEWDQELFERHYPSRSGAALHRAVRCGTLENVRFLIERGADRSLKDGLGRTPADIAREMGFREALALLENNEQAIE